MRPYSKVIQIISVDKDTQQLALCEDGSIWWFDPFSGRFQIIQEMEDGKYLLPAREGGDE